MRTALESDIWLFGGGKLFCSLAKARIVDTAEVLVVPILLGNGVPFAPNLSKWKRGPAGRGTGTILENGPS